MAALIKQQAAYELVAGIKEACPDMRLAMHVHATTGVTLVSLMKGWKLGLIMSTPQCHQ